MTQRRQSSSVKPQQPERAEYVPTRLAECGDTLGIRELCGVLGISDRELRRRRQHGAFALQGLPDFPNRFSRSAVEAYLNRMPSSLRRVG